ncbi:RHS repeat-associated core domain-containing protein [Pseudomonas sp. XS1P51]
MHRSTPTLGVIDSRGFPVREVAYHRRSDKDAPQARITQHVHDTMARVSHSRDPRLFALYQNDASTPSNQTSIISLSGVSVLSLNVDAGWRLSLYGTAGQRLEDWDQKLNHLRVAYDSSMRPVAVFEPTAGEEHRSGCFTYAGPSVESARHNRCGQLIRHDDSAGTQHFSEFSLLGAHLEQGRRFLERIELPDWPQSETERDKLLEPQLAITRMSYNSVGELIRHVDALGNEQIQRQTVAGELHETRMKLAGAHEEITLVSDIRYNAFGQIEQQMAGNGVKIRSTFDSANGRLNTLRAQVASEPPLKNLVYAYDPTGNPIRITDDTQSIRYVRNQRVAAINTYQYDTLGQLIEARGRQRVNMPGGPHLPGFVSPPDSSQLENYLQTFDYDANGNLETLYHHADSGNRTELTAVATWSNRSLPCLNDRERAGDSEIDSRYDANGNLKELQRGQTLQWDAHNRLRQVDQVIREDGPDDVENYVYDGGDQRVRKIRTAYTGTLNRTHETRYLPDVEIRTTPDETLHVISVQAGRCTVRILHWEEGRPSDIPQNQLRYCLADHLDSSTLELDRDAALISQESYYPYGGTARWAGREKVEASYKTIRYSGQERDATGLYYYGFRYYMPWRQRWLSADPAGVADGLNLYRMVGGNPVSYIDDLGLARKRFRAAKATFIRGAIKGIVKESAKNLSAAALVAHVSNKALTVGGAAIGALAAGITVGAITEILWPGNISRRTFFRNMAAGIVAMTILIGHFTSGESNKLAVKVMALAFGSIAGSIAKQLIRAVGPSNDEKKGPAGIVTNLVIKQGLGQGLEVAAPYLPSFVTALIGTLKSGATKAITSSARELTGAPTKEGKGGSEIDTGKFIKPIALSVSTKLMPGIDFFSTVVSLFAEPYGVARRIATAGLTIAKKLTKTTIGQQISRSWKSGTGERPPRISLPTAYRW